MKRILFACLILAGLNSSAQVAVEVLQFRPTGQLGAIMKKTISGEVLIVQDFDDDWRARIGISYASLKPRLDTFPVTSVIISNTTTVIPGYEVYHKYNMFFISAGMDYDLLKGDHFFLYPGMDILIGGVNSVYDHVGYTDGSTSGGDMFGGLKFRAGGEYEFKSKIRVFAELTRSIYLVQEQGLLNHNEIGLGIRFNFK